MRNLKKILALVLALMMVLSVMVFASATNLEDYADSEQVSEEYAEAVDVLSGMGILKGSEGKLYPKDYVQRSHVSTMIYRMMSTDVADAQVHIYEDYGMFDDVSEDNWFAGFVNYSANNELVKGVGDNKFNPSGYMTGYELITILLRAIGYDQNNEISGSDWKITAAGLAKQAGILGDFNETTLGSYLTREQIAYLMFNAMNVPQVTYTPALGYETDDLFGNVNDSIGEENFGLTYTHGIVVGNQATGESTTKISWTNSGVAYSYNDAFGFNTTTGLDLFGHQVKVWYDATGNTTNLTTYALADEATNVAVMDEGLTLADYQAAGFSTAHGASTYRSDGYDKMDTNYMSGTYPFYVAISNSALLTPDVLIGVDATVEQVTAINNYISNPTVTFGSTGTVAQNKVVEGLSNAVVGNYVIVNTIHGTANISTTITAPYYTLDTVTQTVTGTVRSVGTDGTVTLRDGTTIEKSPLYDYSDMGKATITGGVELTFTLDNNGKYIGVAEPAAEYLYVTYAYWEQTGTSTVTYYLQGVTLNGQITTVEVNRDSYLAAIDITGGEVAVAHRVESGSGTGSVVDTGNYKMMVLEGDTWDAATWNEVLTDENLTAASDQISNTEFLSTSTMFYVIEDFGDNLTVTPYTGVTALVGDATSVTVSGPYTKTSLATETTTNANWLVNTVLVSDITYTYAGNYFYAGEETPDATAEKAGDASIKQYNLYVAGASTTTPVWVETDSAVTPVGHNFYTYTRTYDNVLDDYVYTLTRVLGYANNGNVILNRQLSQYQGTAQNYIQAGNDQFKTADDVVVVDLTGVTSISTVAELNRAVQNNDVFVDCLMTADRSEVVVIYVTSVTEA